ncbi:MAG: hypothetical protein FWB91_06280 [Defluviitaleaceae bacterium]|nr:hypothetical protein [Defluviitaleaceae bacterium]
MNVAFRIDISESVGMGHYVRMSALADAFAELGCRFTFFKSEDEPVDYLPFDIVIVDTYRVSDEYIAALNSPGRLLVCCDDNALYTYSCDVLLNANSYAEELHFRFGEKTPKLLLGTQYALLRREFRDVPTIKVRENANHVFICFGGSDPCNFTPQAIRALHDDKDVVITAALGAGTRCDNEVMELANNNVRVLKNPDYLPQVMGECDIAITAAGSMIYELAVMGMPTILVTQADNQSNAAGYLHRNKYMRWIGDWKSVSYDTIRAETKNLLKDAPRRKSESEQLLNKVNPNGALNAASTILAMLK